MGFAYSPVPAASTYRIGRTNRSSHVAVSQAGEVMRRKRKQLTFRRPAKNLYLRDSKSIRFKEKTLTPKFIKFVEQEIWPKLKSLHHGYRIKEKKQTTAQIIHSLICSGLTYKVVADSRDYNNREVRRRVVIWDTLAKQHYCKICKGSEIVHQVTRYGATNKLLKIKKIWELKVTVSMTILIRI